MCRYNQLWGSAMIAFGLGMLLGGWMEGGFVLSCFSLGIAVFGLVILKK